MPQGEDANSCRNRARAVVTYYTSRMDAVSLLHSLPRSDTYPC
jgi:hypothetical protein